MNVWERSPDERSELLETHRASFESEKLLRFKLDSKRKQVGHSITTAMFNGLDIVQRY